MFRPKSKLNTYAVPCRLVQGTLDTIVDHWADQVAEDCFPFLAIALVPMLGIPPVGVVGVLLEIHT